MFSYHPEEIYAISTIKAGASGYLEKIELILVGISENKMAEKTLEFIQKLKNYISIPLEFADETLSSSIIHQKLANSHMRLKKRQQPIDHYAAAEILEEWLEIN